MKTKYDKFNNYFQDGGQKNIKNHIFHIKNAKFLLFFTYFL